MQGIHRCPPPLSGRAKAYPPRPTPANQGGRSAVWISRLVNHRSEPPVSGKTTEKSRVDSSLNTFGHVTIANDGTEPELTELGHGAGRRA